jgi:hypothetical protein
VRRKLAKLQGMKEAYLSILEDSFYENIDEDIEDDK